MNDNYPHGLCSLHASAAYTTCPNRHPPSAGGSKTTSVSIAPTGIAHASSERSAFRNQLQASGVQCPVSTAYARQKLAAATVSHQRAASLQRFLSLRTTIGFAHLGATPECPRAATSSVGSCGSQRRLWEASRRRTTTGWPNLNQTNVISNCAEQLRTWCALLAH